MCAFGRSLGLGVSTRTLGAPYGTCNVGEESTSTQLPVGDNILALQTRLTGRATQRKGKLGSKLINPVNAGELILNREGNSVIIIIKVVKG